MIRTICAMLLCLGFLALSLTQSRQLNDARHRLGASLVTSSWYFSELIFEAEAFGTSVVRYRAGEGALRDVQTQFGVVQGRLDLLRRLDLSAQPNILALTRDFDALLQTQDPTLTAQTAPSAQQLEGIRTAVATRVTQLRAAWINDFVQKRFDTFSPEARDLSAKRRQYDLAAYVVISAVVLYLLTEVFFASRAQATERRLTQAAQTASQAKTDFIASVSHEIRTPLNGILGMADALRESDLDAEQAHYLDVLSDSGGVLLATINDVLELSRIEAGNIDLFEKSFDLRKSLHTVHTLYQENARSKGLTFQLDCDDSVPEAVIGDQRRLRQVLHNLVGNAIKFTENGTVSMRAHFVQPGDATGQIPGTYVVIRDTGPGIDRAAHARIFEPFGQADSSITRRHGGTGLGLAISRDICRAMGGDLTVNSGVGRGATFTVFAPFPVAEAGAVEAGKSTDQTTNRDADWSGLRVLVVDDSATNRLVLRKFLRDTPLALAEADGGQAALDQMPEFAPHLVLLDIQMPQMDGTETARRIAAMAQAGQCEMPRITAVTANAMPDQIDAYLKAGLDEVLCKPINRHRLYGAIDRAAWIVNGAHTPAPDCDAGSSAA